ncbi:MAG: hypothetical protein ABWY11_18630 [Umezawaea sp.]
MVVVVVVVVEDEDGEEELEPLDDETGLEVPDGMTVAQFAPVFGASLVLPPDPSRRTPNNTPANADAATAEPHAAQSTRTAVSFTGVARTRWGRRGSTETVPLLRGYQNASAGLNRAIVPRPEFAGARRTDRSHSPSISTSTR